MIHPTRALVSLVVVTGERHWPATGVLMKPETVRTFNLSRMWKKARRSIDSFPTDLYSGGKVRCPSVRDSDIVNRRYEGNSREMYLSRSREIILIMCTRASLGRPSFFAWARCTLGEIPHLLGSR